MGTITDFCSGCSVCAAVCSQQAIDITVTRGGYLKSEINKEKCIKCGICNLVCPSLAQSALTNITSGKFYAMRSDDESQLAKSSSGGIAHLIAENAIREGKVVCGAVYDTETQRVKHILTERDEDIPLFDGSKYLPSFTQEAFTSLVGAAKNTDKSFVVFGVPCQISGLANFLKIKKLRDRFTLVELFCHGYPPLTLWDKQLEIIERELGCKPEKVTFRDKSSGWHNYRLKAEANGKAWHGGRADSLFYSVYFEDMLLPECCAGCHSRLTVSSADIRLGDYWGNRYKKDKNGVSGAFAMTENGQKVLEAVKAEHLEGDAAEMLSCQNMKRYKQSKLRDSSVRMLESTGDIEKTVEYYRKRQNIKQKAKRLFLKIRSHLQ